MRLQVLAEKFPLDPHFKYWHVCEQLQGCGMFHRGIAFRATGILARGLAIIGNARIAEKLLSDLKDVRKTLPAHLQDLIDDMETRAFVSEKLGNT